MRIMVVGPGAIGSLFAARLAAAGTDVVLLDNDPGRAQKVMRQGIQIQREDRTEVFRVPVLCFADPRDTRPSYPVDVVLICVKAYDTAQAARDIQPACRTGTLIVSLQNGIGNDRILAGMYPRDHLLCASTGTGSTWIRDGVVREAGRGPLIIAPCDGIWTDEKAKVADVLHAAGENVDCSDDPASLVWSKAILNAAINPLTVLFDLPNGALLDHPSAHALMLSTAREGQRIATALNISLLYRDAAAEVETVCRVTANNVSSMLQDHRAGRRTEIDAINGAIVQHAVEAGIAAPVNAELVSRIHAFEPTKTHQ